MKSKRLQTASSHFSVLKIEKKCILHIDTYPGRLTPRGSPILIFRLYLSKRSNSDFSLYFQLSVPYT